MIIDWLDVTCSHCGHDGQVAVLDLVSNVGEPRCDACREPLAIRPPLAPAAVSAPVSEAAAPRRGGE
jgi:hypothetical protein